MQCLFTAMALRLSATPGAAPSGSTTSSVRVANARCSSVSTKRGGIMTALTQKTSPAAAVMTTWNAAVVAPVGLLQRQCDVTIARKHCRTGILDWNVEILCPDWTFSEGINIITSLRLTFLLLLVIYFYSTFRHLSTCTTQNEAKFIYG